MDTSLGRIWVYQCHAWRSCTRFLVVLLAFPRFNEIVLAVDVVSSFFVGISTPLTALDEDGLPDAIGVARSKPLGLPTAFSDEDVDATRADTDVDRPTT